METTIYNPANQSPSDLISRFVVRTKVFQKIFADIKSGDMKYPEQHYLIQGQRGMGKTTLLLRLKYEIESTEELNSWLVPVFFNEESYDLTSLSNLWEKLLKYLDNLWKTGGTYYNQSFLLDEEDYEKKCFDLLISILREKGKKLVIFFDNIGQLFLDNLKDRERRRFREILMDNNDIRIVGASAIVLKDVHDYKEPFYEFFKIIPLEGLNKKETFEFITKLSEHGKVNIDLDKNKSKIETLGILTGGVIRTLMLVYEVILADQDGSALSDLEFVLDRITPLYKHRIEDLPVQQRKIIDVIAKQWDAVSAKEIAEQIREDGKTMQTKLVSAQLQMLERNNVVEKKQTNTKNHLYQVKERFFNIWYLMRNGDRHDRRKVMWLTRFLELWYNDEEGFDVFMSKHIKLIKSGRYNAKSALLLSEALSISDKLNVVSLDRLLRETATILDEEQKKQLPSVRNKLYHMASMRFGEERFEEAINILQAANEIGDREKLLLAFCFRALKNESQTLKYLAAISDEDNELILYKGLVYAMTNKKQEALNAISKYQLDDNPDVYHMVGSVYVIVGELDQAEKIFLKAIALGSTRSYKTLSEIYKSRGDRQTVEKYLLAGLAAGEDLYESILEFYLDVPFENKERYKAESILDGVTEQMYQKNPKFYIYKALSFLAQVERRGGKGFSEKKYLGYLERAHKESKKSPNNANENIFKAMRAMMLIEYIQVLKEKEKAKAILSELEDYGVFTLHRAFVAAWDSKYQQAIDIILTHYKDINMENDIVYLNSLLVLLMSRKQYHSVLKLFNEIANLKDILKPSYYALMKLLSNEFPNEYTKMGSELQQPVKDILLSVEEFKMDYQ